MPDSHNWVFDEGTIEKDMCYDDHHYCIVTSDGNSALILVTARLEYMAEGE